jgi:hypothetical protein
MQDNSRQIKTYKYFKQIDKSRHIKAVQDKAVQDNSRQIKTYKVFQEIDSSRHIKSVQDNRHFKIFQDNSR